MSRLLRFIFAPVLKTGEDHHSKVVYLAFVATEIACFLRAEFATGDIADVEGDVYVVNVSAMRFQGIRPF